jgi:signal transduction histidine kinase
VAGHARPFRRGRAQGAGVAIALVLLAVLGVVEAKTPPNVTIGGFLLLVVLISTWLFSVPAAAAVTVAALSVPVIAYSAGGDDLVLSEVEFVSVLALAVSAHLGLRSIERYEHLLARRNRDLVEVNASLERFTADAAHEFRAPLAVVLSEVDLALARSASPAEAGHLQTIRAEVERMRRTVSGLLTLARSDAGVLQASFRKVDLVDLLEECLGRWRPLFADQAARMDGHLPESGDIVCDPDLLVRVIDNLLDNALHAVPRGGCVILAARRDGGDWLIIVSDDGPGVSSDVARLLDGSGTRPAARGRGSGGTGFGLALCSAIVRVHRGSIGVESSSAGASFTVRLPAIGS